MNIYFTKSRTRLLENHLKDVGNTRINNITTSLFQTMGGEVIKVTWETINKEAQDAREERVEQAIR